MSDPVELAKLADFLKSCVASAGKELVPAGTLADLARLRAALTEARAEVERLKARRTAADAHDCMYMEDEFASMKGRLAAAESSAKALREALRAIVTGFDVGAATMLVPGIEAARALLAPSPAAEPEDPRITVMREFGRYPFRQPSGEPWPAPPRPPESLGICAYCEKRAATHIAKYGAKNERPCCDECEHRPPESEVCDHDGELTPQEGVTNREG